MNCLFLLLLCAGMTQAMDIDDTPVPSKKRTRSSSSSSSTQDIVLTEHQQLVAALTIKEVKEQNRLLITHASLNYPHGTHASMSYEDRSLTRDNASNVAENREIYRKNNLIYIVNDIALRLHGTLKSDFTGTPEEQAKRVQEVNNVLETVFKTDKRVLENAEIFPKNIASEQPEKKHKRS